MPNLKELFVPQCDIQPKNLIFLSKMPKLASLDLSQTHLTLSGARSLGACTNLVQLTLRRNSSFDDDCLRCLASLKKLRYLDVTGTQVTVKGLESIKGLSLKELWVERAILQKDEAKLQKLFPSAVLKAPGVESMTPETKHIYAPLH